jgi:hypothetical protein
VWEKLDQRLCLVELAGLDSYIDQHRYRKREPGREIALLEDP